MTDRSRFLQNTLLLTGSSLLMSLIAMLFQVRLAAFLGPTGIGLVQLTLSACGLFAAFAISGVRFAATRLVAEELSGEAPGRIPAAMRSCLAYAAFFGFSAAAILHLLAEPLGFLWLGDARTVRALRLAALSLPCIALCSALSGYFTACGRVWKPALIHLLEQLLSVGFVLLLLGRAAAGDLEQSCAAVMEGRLWADLASLLMLLAAFLGEQPGLKKAASPELPMAGRMLRIALPLAVSSYARSALGTLQHLLVPRGLRSAGYSADRSLAGYGMIQGMVLPVLLFPSCLLTAAAELIVPELTGAQMRRDPAEIRKTAGGFLRQSLIYSLAVSLFLFLCSDALGLALYRSAETGRYLRLLAPLVPVMYTDLAVDGCLKGLGQQVWSMGINVLDALSGLLLVWRLLPKYALPAYLAILYGTELFNFLLSAGRLFTVLRSSPAKAAQRSPAPQEPQG